MIWCEISHMRIARGETTCFIIRNILLVLVFILLSPLGQDGRYQSLQHPAETPRHTLCQHRKVIHLPCPTRLEKLITLRGILCSPCRSAWSLMLILLQIKTAETGLVSHVQMIWRIWLHGRVVGEDTV